MQVDLDKTLAWCVIVSKWLSVLSVSRWVMSDSCDPMDCSPPASSVHGILQARIQEWNSVPFSRGSPRSKDRTQVFCIAGRFFTILPPGKQKDRDHIMGLTNKKNSVWDAPLLSCLSIIFSSPRSWGARAAVIYVFCLLCPDKLHLPLDQTEGTLSCQEFVLAPLNNFTLSEM